MGDRAPLVTMDRAALLQRIAKLREEVSATAIHALTEGRPPEELTDDGLRYLIAAIERAIPREA